MGKYTNFRDYEHFVGRWWMLTGFALLLAVPAAICVVYDAWPPLTWVLEGLLGVAPIYWTVGTIEVLTYVPMLGTGGSYLGFFTGNLTSLKVPCALNAMESAGVEPGSEEGEVISTIAIGVSSLVTTAGDSRRRAGPQRHPRLHRVAGAAAGVRQHPARALRAAGGGVRLQELARGHGAAGIHGRALRLCAVAGLLRGVLVPVGAIIAIAAARILYKKGLV